MNRHMYCAVPRFYCDTVVVMRVNGDVGELYECTSIYKYYVCYTVRAKLGPVIIQTEYEINITPECIDFKD
jgi:hypothetical protein